MRLALMLCLTACLAAQPNLHHIAGSSRKIRMVVSNFYLRLSHDGRVIGTQEESSPETVLQRSSVTVGKVKIQGVATCMYLCMDICGFPYASKEYSEECVFNEMIEENHYNSYSSAKYSNARRTLYLGLNKRGQGRMVITRGGALGKQSAYARVLTQPVQWQGRNTTCAPAAKVVHTGPPRCKLRLRRPRRRKRKRCREEEICRKRKSRLRIRHRKHRGAPENDDEFLEREEEEEDVTMTTEDEEDHTLADSSE
ncbi:fibroblast growth factor 7 [Halyomorpha halys]|uniref:fibroblast growth factor 7 n=1 Tax=Halyomorpha halys TaxID=286706 RepID=UPI0034D1929F